MFPFFSLKLVELRIVEHNFENVIKPVLFLKEKNPFNNARVCEAGANNWRIGNSHCASVIWQQRCKQGQGEKW